MHIAQGRTLLHPGFLYIYNMVNFQTQYGGCPNAKHCKWQRKALRLNNVNYIYLSFCDVDIPIGPGDPVSGELNDAKSNIEYGYEDDTDTPSYIKDYSPWDD